MASICYMRELLGMYLPIGTPLESDHALPLFLAFHENSAMYKMPKTICAEWYDIHRHTREFLSIERFIPAIYPSTRNALNLSLRFCHALDVSPRFCNVRAVENSSLSIPQLLPGQGHKATRRIK
jgi:hypothetical protein